MADIGDLEKRLNKAKEEAAKKLAEVKSKEDKKLEKIQARLKRAKAKERSQQRKDIDRLKIIIGAIVLEHMKPDNLEYYLGKASDRDRDFVRKTLAVYREKKSQNWRDECLGLRIASGTFTIKIMGAFV